MDRDEKLRSYILGGGLFLWGAITLVLEPFGWVNLGCFVTGSVLLYLSYTGK